VRALSSSLVSAVHTPPPLSGNIAIVGVIRMVSARLHTVVVSTPQTDSQALVETTNMTVLIGGRFANATISS